MRRALVPLGALATGGHTTPLVRQRILFGSVLLGLRGPNVQLKERVERVPQEDIAGHITQLEPVASDLKNAETPKRGWEEQLQVDAPPREPRQPVVQVVQPGDDPACRGAGAAIQQLVGRWLFRYILGDHAQVAEDAEQVCSGMPVGIVLNGYAARLRDRLHARNPVAPFQVLVDAVHKGVMPPLGAHTQSQPTGRVADDACHGLCYSAGAERVRERRAAPLAASGALPCSSAGLCAAPPRRSACTSAYMSPSDSRASAVMLRTRSAEATYAFMSDLATGRTAFGPAARPARSCFW